MHLTALLCPKKAPAKRCAAVTRSQVQPAGCAEAVTLSLSKGCSAAYLLLTFFLQALSVNHTSH